jgi:hypothetical protein
MSISIVSVAGGLVLVLLAFVVRRSTGDAREAIELAERHSGET